MTDDFEFEHVTTSIVDRVGWVEFNRPPVNAFDEQMVRETRDALHGFDLSSDVRVIVLSSAIERYFSAGADLAVFAGIGESGMRSWVARSARLGQPEININFIPPVGATQALARLLGRPRALRFLYDGELIDTNEALSIGLIDEIVEDDELRPTVQRYAERLAEKPPEALAAIRRAVTIGGGLTFEEGLVVEADLATRLAGTANFDEGVQAFLDRRPPNWT